MEDVVDALKSQPVAWFRIAQLAGIPEGRLYRLIHRRTPPRDGEVSKIRAAIERARQQNAQPKAA